MTRKIQGQAGMSLVEATIILMVLAMLTAVLAPSLGDYVEDAKNTKAKEDVEAIGGAILRVLRDTGKPCLGLVGTTACTKANRVDLLVSSTDHNLAAVDASLAYNLPAGSAVNSTISWANGGNAPAGTSAMDTHFVTNGVGYTGVATSGFTAGGGPKVALGWRGAYLSGPISADPWGFRYQANTVFLTVATDATAGTTEGLNGGGWNRDVIVMSSGANGIVQTPFATSSHSGSTASGDDIVYVVQNSTR